MDDLNVIYSGYVHTAGIPGRRATLRLVMAQMLNPADSHSWAALSVLMIGVCARIVRRWGYWSGFVQGTSPGGGRQLGCACALWASDCFSGQRASPGGVCHPGYPGLASDIVFFAQGAARKVSVPCHGCQDAEVRRH